MKDDELTKQVIGCAMKVHRVLGPGFLESVYRNALSHELKKAGMSVDCEWPLRVFYDGIVVGDFMADLVVDGKVIIELKAVRNLCLAHEVQLVHYLSSTGIDVGLLMNFGASSLEFKRKHRDCPGHSNGFNPEHSVNPV